MIGIKVKSAFLDVRKIMYAKTRAAKRVHARYGAFVRQTAKKSFKKNDEISKPGQVPHSHLGLIEKNILFAADSRNVIIGPIALRKPSLTALSALEHGGATIILRRGKPERVTIEAHPFMQPAHEKELAKAPELWQNQIRR